MLQLFHAIFFGKLIRDDLNLKTKLYIKFIVSVYSIVLKLDSSTVL